MIETLDTGLIYRNPEPERRAIHAWHPSVVVLDDGELFASFDLASGVDAHDYTTYMARSLDGGTTWSEPELLVDFQGPRPTTGGIRVALTRDKTLVGIGGRTYRDGHGGALINRVNLGHAPMDLITTRSSDGGHTWSKPQIIAQPIASPAWEVCHQIVELADGRWLAPMAPWRGWDGEEPIGMKALAFVSHDQGETWPEHIVIMDQFDRGIYSWEVSLRQLNDGRLVATCWAFDLSAGHSELNPYAISTDGETFSPPRSTGIPGQTGKMLVLPDDRILFVYRRDDTPGLWANLSLLDDDTWVNVAEAPLWQGAPSGMTGTTDSSAQELLDLKFGFPSLALLPNGSVYVAFWGEEQGVYNIRWFKLQVT